MADDSSKTDTKTDKTQVIDTDAIIAMAKQAAEDAATAAVAAALADFTSKQVSSTSDLLDQARKAGADAAAAAVKAVGADLAANLPPMFHSNWDSLKGWVRKELELVADGHSVQTRSTVNP